MVNFPGPPGLPLNPVSYNNGICVGCCQDPGSDKRRVGAGRRGLSGANLGLLDVFPAFISHPPWIYTYTRGECVKDEAGGLIKIELKGHGAAARISNLNTSGHGVTWRHQVFGVIRGIEVLVGHKASCGNHFSLEIG